MKGARRDTTDERRVPQGRTPATVTELEGRIDVALATARSAEEAALEIGAASLEAAEQARRAAVLAERASAAAVRAAATPQAGAPDITDEVPRQPAVPRVDGAAPRRADPFEERITAFRLRAEKVMIRLQKIETGPPGAQPSEVVGLG